MKNRSIIVASLLLLPLTGFAADKLTSTSQVNEMTMRDMKQEYTKMYNECRAFHGKEIQDEKPWKTSFLNENPRINNK